MAVTHSSTEFTVTGGVYSGTATSATATTLTDSTAPFVTTIAGRYVWIHTGTGVGALGYIDSHTTSQLTCDLGFWRTDFTGQALEQVTPDATSQYRVAYTFEDIYQYDVGAAVGAMSKQGVMQYASTRKIVTASTGFLSSVKEHISIDVTAPIDMLISAGSRLTLGRHIFFDYGTSIKFDRPESNFSESFSCIRNYGDIDIFGNCNIIGTPDGGMSDGAPFSTEVGSKTTILGGDGSRVIFDGIGQWRARTSNVYVDGLKKTKGAQISYLAAMPPLTNLILVDCDDGLAGSTAISASTFRVNSPVIKRSSNYDVWIYAGHTLELINPNWGRSVRNVDSNGQIKEIYTWDFTATDSGGALSGVGVYAENSSGTVLINTDTDANGNIAQQEVLYKHWVNSVTETTYTDNVFRFRKYGYIFIEETSTVSSPVVASKVFNINPYVTLSDAAATALTGYTFVGDTSITLSITHTASETYDKSQSWADDSGNRQYSVPFITADGNAYSLNGYDLTLSGVDLTGSGALNIGSNAVNLNSGAETTLTLNGGTINIDTVQAYVLSLTTNTVNFTTTGTYDLTGCTITGTVTFTATAAVTVQVAIGTLYDDTDVNVTVVEIGDIPTLTVSADSATATVRGFTNDTQTTVFSESDGSVAYAYPNTNPIDIEIVEQGYVPINEQDVVPFDGPINYTMDIDEAYNASHSLTIVTHYTLDRGTKNFNILSDQNAFDVRSSMADTIRTNSSYYNTPLLLEAKPGGKRIDLIDGATITSMATWKGAGMERYDALGTIYPIEKWYAIQSVQDITGASVIYRQTNSGDFTIGALTGGKFDETLQFYSDTTVPPDNSPETNNDSYLLIKALRVGYRQARNDVVAGNGGASLKADLYTIGLAPTAHDYAGNPATDLSLTMTLVAGPFTVGGKTFAYKWVDAGTNSGTDIADWINYMGATSPNGLIPGSTGLRWAEMPDMVIYNGSEIWTANGYREGATPTLAGFYVERGGADHPDFAKFESDTPLDFYTPAVTANITITNLPDDLGGNTRLQIYNVTTASEYYNNDPVGTGYSASYTDGVGISAGDSIRVRFAHLNAGTSFEYGETFTTASSSGFTVDGNNFIAADSVYASNGINGSTITNFTADFVEDQIEIASDTDFTAAQAYAFYCYQLTNTTGIGDFWGGVTAIDTGNYRINTSVVSIYFDSPVGVTYSVKQTDTGRIFRSDDAYPVKDPTTSGYGVQINWKNVVYVQNVGGSALTAAESAALTSIKSKTDSLTFTVAGQVDANTESMNGHALQGDGSESDKIRTINAP